MSKWLIENRIGMNPPFLLKNIARTLQKTHCRLQEKDCCKFTLLEIPSVKAKIEIYGRIKTDGWSIPVSPALGKPITLFSCHDVIDLYFFLTQSKKVRLFRLELNCCKSWSTEILRAHEIGLFGIEQFIEEGNSFIEIRCKIENLRSPDDYHYNTPENILLTSSKKVIPIEFFNNRYSIMQYNCPLCFRNYEHANDLIYHINYQHLYYTCTKSNDILHFQPRCSEMPGEESHCTNKTSDGDKASDGDKTSDDGKASDIDKIIEGFPIIKREKYKFTYLKKRDGKVYDYKLSNYYLQIDKEYRGLDYSESLANHLNLLIEHSEEPKNDPGAGMPKNDSGAGIKRIASATSHSSGNVSGNTSTHKIDNAKASSKNIASMDELELMKFWNREMLLSDDLQESLKSALEHFGLGACTIKLMDILYTKGLLDTREILSVIDLVYKEA